MHADTARLVVRPVASEADWADARAIREAVFVVEQACPPEHEWDEWDADDARGRTCHHVLGFVDGQPVATARWRPFVLDGASAAKLERFAVLPAWRGGGRGRALVQHVLDAARAAGHTRFVLYAQAHLERFYASFGFRPEGDVFWEAGLPHLKMTCTDPPARGPRVS